VNYWRPLSILSHSKFLPIKWHVKEAQTSINQGT